MSRFRPLEDLYTPEPNTGCWLFLGFIDKAGYGQLRSRHDGRKLTAHVAFYEALVGPVDAEDLDHAICHNRPCVNPAHMEPVSHRENMRRSNGPMGRNARKTHCKRGHEFTDETTLRRPNGNRDCRLCIPLRRAELLARRRPALSEAA